MISSIPCLTYLITDGSSTPETFSADTQKILSLVNKAVENEISFFQVREKQITTRQLFELSRAAALITANSRTKLLINDRADVAAAAGADGVHLTSHSLPASVIRENFSAEFVIGVSTHSLETALQAKEQGANFITFSPIFPTQSKINYGGPQGIEKLNRIIKTLDGFPVFALGGINKNNYQEILDTGAAGIAGISLFYEALM